MNELDAPAQDVAEETRETTLFESICELLSIEDKEKQTKFENLLNLYLAERVGVFLNHKDNILILSSAMSAANANSINELRELKEKLNRVKPVFIHEEKLDSVRCTFEGNTIGDIKLEVYRDGNWIDFTESNEIMTGYKTFAWNHWDNVVGTVGYIWYPST